MATIPSEHIAGVSYDDTTGAITISPTVEPWASLIAQCDPLTAQNTEQRDQVLMYGLQAECIRLDPDPTSPIGMARLSPSTSYTNAVVRVDETNGDYLANFTELKVGCYSEIAGTNPASAVNRNA